MMIPADRVNECCQGYTGRTLQGLADRLSIGRTTLYRVISGEYAPGRSYSLRPSAGRRIANDCFAVVREAADHLRQH